MDLILRLISDEIMECKRLVTSIKQKCRIRISSQNDLDENSYEQGQRISLLGIFPSQRKRETITGVMESEAILLEKD